ncbi:MAG: hypothetical protein QW804_00605 [Candidatus Bathyarchaeia archaeon]|nr:hypothetical protein [Candidatus Bathyarchaeota archaeon]
MEYMYVSEDKQVVDLNVSVVDVEGKPKDKYLVFIYHLTEDGPIKLSEAFVLKGGLLQVTIPRKYIMRYGGIGVFASVNLLIDVFTEDYYVGGQVLSLDPTLLKWPRDAKSVQIKLSKIDLFSNCSVAQSQIEQQGSPPRPGYTTANYSFTPVLEYAVWTNIYAKTEYPIGSKVRVECKRRYYNAATGEIISPWFSLGATEVTMDRSVISGEHTGEKKYKLYFEFKYIYRTECVVSAPPLAYEIVYAADTSLDPRDYCRVQESWGGNLPGYQHYYITHQGDTSEIPVSGGVNYVWSVGAGFSISVGYNVSVDLGVSVSVTPAQAPRAKLIIRAGSWQQGYVIRTETPDETFRVSYSNWVLWGS